MAIVSVDILAVATGLWVPAELHDVVATDDLFDVEDQWGRPRRAIRTALRAARVPSTAWPESLHWDWGRKGLGLTAGRDPADVRAMGIRRQGWWEAAMVTRRRQDADGPLVYVEYIEIAPWNWSVAPIGQQRRYATVGSILLQAAVQQSTAEGFSGRVGLHALPQAEAFYRKQGFRFVRRDADEEGLAYYEHSANPTE